MLLTKLYIKVACAPFDNSEVIKLQWQNVAKYAEKARNLVITFHTQIIVRVVASSQIFNQCAFSVQKAALTG